MSRLSIVFAGSGEFGLPSLRRLVAEHHVVRVYTQPDRPAGRGRKLTPTPVGQFCLTTTPPLPVTPTADLNAEDVPACDVLVVIAFGQKVADSVIARARLGAVNLHASCLPKYRGAAPIHRAIEAGESVTGNSVIRLAQKMDAGAVLAMSELCIGELETTGELHDRLAEDGAPLLLGVLSQLATGSAVEVQQDHAQATLARKIRREETALDFARPAAELARRIRAFYPWPGCRVEVSGGGKTTRLTLVRARPVTGTATPGLVTDEGHVGTGDGLIEVVEVQPEGGKPMPLAAFRNGYPWSGCTVRGIV